MPINSNQFGMTATQGMQDLNTHGATVISGVIDQTQSGTVLPGTPLKQVATSNGIPSVIAATNLNDRILGFALYSVKNGTYSNAVNNGALEIAQRGTVMYMTAGAAIVAQAPVMMDIANTRVLTRTTGNSAVGYALDAAAALGDLIRVHITAGPTDFTPST